MHEELAKIIDNYRREIAVSQYLGEQLGQWLDRGMELRREVLTRSANLARALEKLDQDVAEELGGDDSP